MISVAPLEHMFATPSQLRAVLLNLACIACPLFSQACLVNFTDKNMLTKFFSGLTGKLGKSSYRDKCLLNYFRGLVRALPALPSSIGFYQKGALTETYSSGIWGGSCRNFW